MAFSRTETLDTLYTTTWWARRKEISDAIFTATPIYYSLTKKGRMQPQVGGTRVEVPIEFDTNPTVAWIGKGGTVSLTDVDPLTVASDVWRYLVGNITRYGVDEQQNQGKHQIKRIVTVKIDNLKKTLIDNAESAIFGAQSGQSMNGLQNLVATDPTATATVMGIAQGTYSWWRNQYTDMTTYPMDTYLREKMENMFNTISSQGQKMGATPDFIATTQTVYEAYVSEVFELVQMQISDKNLADLGFGNMAFKGVPLTWSPKCTAGYMYMLNLDTLFLLYDPTMWFSMTNWKEIVNQVGDKAAQSISAIQLLTSNRRGQGILFNLA